MKKNIALVPVVLLIVTLSIFVYNQYVAKSFRYANPTEAFSHSKLREGELLDILQDKNVALLIYKRKDGTYSDHIVAKDGRGWTPLTMNYANKHQQSVDNGFVSIKEVQGKSVVKIVMMIKENKNHPVILDNANSTFMSKLYELGDGEKIMYGFLVLAEDVQNDYVIKLGDQEIRIS